MQNKKKPDICSCRKTETTQLTLNAITAKFIRLQWQISQINISKYCKYIELSASNLFKHICFNLPFSFLLPRISCPEHHSRMLNQTDWLCWSRMLCLVQLVSYPVSISILLSFPTENRNYLMNIKPFASKYFGIEMK